MSQSKRMKNTKIDPLIRDMKNLPKLNVKPNNKKDKIKKMHDTIDVADFFAQGWTSKEK